METLEPARPLQPEEPGAGADVVEIRPVDVLRVCPNCLVHNTATDKFCTGCGEALPGAAPGEGESAVMGVPVAEARTEVIGPAATVVSPPVPRSAFEPPVSGRQLRGGKLVATMIALVVAVAGVAVFASLWQMQASHANRLQRDLAQSRSDLSATKERLAATKAELASATSLSDKRRAVLVQAKDVVAKVDPLLSSVDNIQGKASNLSAQGSTLTGDAEVFIGTVADLVNYLVRSSGGYVDYAWVQQQIDAANSQLGTLRYDESTFSSGDSGYADASKSFGVKANAFSASVRSLQEQLKAVTEK